MDEYLRRYRKEKRDPTESMGQPNRSAIEQSNIEFGLSFSQEVTVLQINPQIHTMYETTAS